MRGLLCVFFGGLLLLSACSPDESDMLGPGDVFVKFYGGSSVETAADFVVREDGGFVLFGTTTQNDGGDFYLVFTDSYGNQEGSTVIIENDGEETASRIRKTRNGGYILVGSSLRPNGPGEVGQSDIFIVKVASDRSFSLSESAAFIGERADTVGTVISPSHEIGADIVEYDSISPELNGGFIVVGSTTNRNKADLPSRGTEIYIARLADDLSFVGDKTEGFAGEDRATSVELNRTSVVVVGSTERSSDSGGGGSNVIYLERSISDLGGTASPIFGGNSDEVPARLRRIANGDYYLVGNAGTGNARSAFVMRIISGVLNEHEAIRYLNANAEPPVDEPITGIVASDIVRIPGNDYLVVGEKLTSDDLRGSEMLLTRVDPTGVVQEGFGDSRGASETVTFGNAEVDIGEIFGGANTDRAVAVEVLPDGSIVFLGTMDLDGSGNTYFSLIKTNRNGVLGK